MFPIFRFAGRTEYLVDHGLCCLLHFYEIAKFSFVFRQWYIGASFHRTLCKLAHETLHVGIGDFPGVGHDVTFHRGGITISPFEAMGIVFVFLPGPSSITSGNPCAVSAWPENPAAKIYAGVMSVRGKSPPLDNIGT